MSVVRLRRTLIGHELPRWQIAAAAMEEMMTKGTREQVDRLTQALLPMKKLDIAKLQEAFEGKRKPKFAS